MITKVYNLKNKYQQSILFLGALLLSCITNRVNAESNTFYVTDSLQPSKIEKTIEIEADSTDFYLDSNKTIVVLDSLVPVEESLKKDSVRIVYKYASTKRAVLFSMILPGLGQVYNKKYWKVPIIYGGGAILYYFYDLNNDFYLRFKKSYDELLAYDQLKAEYNQFKPAGAPEWNEYNPISDREIAALYGTDKRSLSLNRDYYRRNRDYNLIFFGLLYFANIIDAMVDSHMLYYDVSNDLSLKVDPYIMPVIDNPYSQSISTTCGLSLTLRIK